MGSSIFGATIFIEIYRAIVRHLSDSIRINHSLIYSVSSEKMLSNLK